MSNIRDTVDRLPSRIVQHPTLTHARALAAIERARKGAA